MRTSSSDFAEHEVTQKTVKMSIWIQQLWGAAQDSAFLTRPVWWVLWPGAASNTRAHTSVTFQGSLPASPRPHLGAGAPEELPVPFV